MKKIIKHYPMTDRLIVRWGYMYLSTFPGQLVQRFTYYSDADCRHRKDCCL